MAYWKKKLIEFDAMDKLIRKYPGIRPAAIASQLGVARSTITRRLPSMDEVGYLYSEDVCGGLWRFDA